ncbi:MAG: hypothetical protein GY755_25515 [Chloroflexi bacterium]|nr:hypothetical protein [Chloroflexota bacterium]
MNRKRNFILLPLLTLIILACSLSQPKAQVAPVITLTPIPEAMPITPIPTALPPTATATIVVEKEFSALFDAANSGNLCPKGPIDVVGGSPPSVIGEKNDSYDCEGYWTFDIQGLPRSAVISSAIFSPGTCTTSGTPFSYGDLGFELVEYNILAIGDYGNGGIGYFQNDEIALMFKNCSPSSMNITAHVTDRFIIEERKIIQIRAYITSGNFSNGVNDYVSFSGTTPTLIIKYK